MVCYLPEKSLLPGSLGQVSWPCSHSLPAVASIACLGQRARHHQSSSVGFAEYRGRTSVVPPLPALGVSPIERAWVLVSG